MEAFFALAIAALVKLFDSIVNKNWRAVVLIVGSAVLGLLLGLLGWFGLDPATGIAYGLSASGLVTVASYAGGIRTKTV